MTAARSAASDLGDRRAVHRLRVRRLTGRDTLDRAAGIVVDLAALDLAEVQVVDGADPAQQLAVGRDSVRTSWLPT